MASEFDEDLLETAVERRAVLTTLAEAPHHRRELQETLDISKTTCHRIVRTFDNHGLLRRTDNGYTLSTKGELIAEQTSKYVRHMRAACHLGPLAEAFEDTEFEFDVELFSDARVTRPEPDDPTLPISHEFQIFQDSESHLLLDYNQYIPPLYIEQLAELILEQGMQLEQTVPKEMVEERLERFDDLHRQQVKGEIDATISYNVHDGIPFGMTIYDRSHVVLRAYDDETGSIAVLVDTDDPEAVAWAEEVYEHYRERARSPEEVEGLPDWTPSPDLDI